MYTRYPLLGINTLEGDDIWAEFAFIQLSNILQCGDRDTGQCFLGQNA